MNPLLLKAAPYLVVLLVAGGWRYSDVRRQRTIGQLNERLHIADSTLVVARQDSAELATRYATERTVWGSDSARWVALVRRARARVETLPPLPGETIPGPERIVIVRDSTPPTFDEILRQADATIRSCSTALGTCEERIGNAERRAALFEQQRDAYRRLQPSGFQKARTSIRDAAIGAALCYFVLCPKR